MKFEAIPRDHAIKADPFTRNRFVPRARTPECRNGFRWRGFACSRNINANRRLLSVAHEGGIPVATGLGQVIDQGL
ncbi:MAG: hypothetical protein HY678_12035 [Chloroflexi bacterium]|nr:hypothetical protein [Chloroflexota bacterium]